VSRKHKWAIAVVLIACSIALIAWNLRDPDRAYREPPKEERVVTLDAVPQPVQETIRRLAKGGKIEQIKEKQQGAKTTFEADVTLGDTKTELKLAEDGSVIKEKSKKLKPAGR
jgi:hypothetical protein